MKGFSSDAVLKLYDHLDAMGIKIWIDGGWAVDALIGEQTRPHKDLDIALQREDLSKLRQYLESQGYKEVPRDEDKKWDLVLGDDQGHEVDIHAFSFDGTGRVVEEDDWAGYSADSLTGQGTIEGREVRCVSLGQIMKTHDGAKRPLRDIDMRDIQALSKKFNLRAT